MTMTTGERIKNRRKDLGMSAEDLASKVGISPATIYRYEKGDIEKVPGDVLFKIGKALYVTPSYLMGWEEEEEPDDAMRIAEELRNRPGMRMLFDATKKATDEDLIKVAEFIEMLRGRDD